MKQLLTNYSAWDIDTNDFPKTGTLQEQFVFLARYGMLAPSTHNTQPWLFKITENSIQIHPNWKARLAHADPSDKNLFISLGCCAFNIIVAGAFFHFSVKTTFHDEVKERAYIELTISPSQDPNEELSKLFPYIVTRYSNKLAYLDKKLPEEFITQITNIAEEAIEIYPLTHIQLKEKMGEFHEFATKEFGKNKHFRKELATWLKVSNTKEDNGMPGFVAGLSIVPSFIGKLVLPFFPPAIAVVAKKDRKLIESSPAVCLLLSDKNDIKTWISVGLMYERLSLFGGMYAIHFAPMHSMVENHAISEEVRKFLGLKKEHIQFFFRLGYSDSRPYHTPRKSIDKVLL